MAGSAAAPHRRRNDRDDALLRREADGALTLQTGAQALRLLAKRGAMTLTRVTSPPGAKAPPALVDEVAGEEVRGSWWSHPKGAVIFRVATALEESPDVVVAKLARAKVTFVHRTLWPALLCVVTHARFRAPRKRALGPEARRLLTRVERSGHLRIDDRALAKAKAALEASALVRGFSEHTDAGHHATVLETWTSWADRAGAEASLASDLEASLTKLRAAGIELAVIS